ncbi:MAG: Gfo/Idh/MocA family oxidoreductase [Rhodospirillales bacterium]|nr:Gfo/Idh/MocA family oxidoreductase [Alphaproteobacteria bacterium]MCB9986830.1 Gfo/Idh/MocA family oxidoreductase [Rhodospirillales bacterium]USO08406.1 MAG: Gfo/Idh/MocA family oxidoreductase [Rhodospirillales bacterium]
MTPGLKLGFLGGGVNSAIGHVHEIACRMDLRFDLVAGCFSRHADVNRHTADAYAIDPARLYSDLDALLKAEAGNLDALAILTPPDQHADQIIAALDAGLPVICEKPLATSAAESARVRAALERTGGFLGVTYNYLAYPMIRELKSVIESGQLGEIRQIMAEMPQEGFLRLRPDDTPMTPQDWRRRDYTISTVTLDLGAHLHMFVNFLTGRAPESVAATAATFGNFPGIVDTLSAIAKYEGGLHVNMWLTKAALGQRNGLRLRVCGSEGTAEWFQLEPETLGFADRHGRRWTLDRGHPDSQIASQPRYTRFKTGHPAGFIEAFANCYADLADAIHAHKAGNPAPAPYVVGIGPADEGMRFLEAMTQAASRGEWMDVT